MGARAASYPARAGGINGDADASGTGLASRRSTAHARRPSHVDQRRRHATLVLAERGGPFGRDERLAGRRQRIRGEPAAMAGRHGRRDADNDIGDGLYLGDGIDPERADRHRRSAAPPPPSPRTGQQPTEQRQFDPVLAVEPGQRHCRRPAGGSGTSGSSGADTSLQSAADTLVADLAKATQANAGAAGGGTATATSATADVAASSTTGTSTSASIQSVENSLAADITQALQAYGVNQAAGGNILASA